MTATIATETDHPALDTRPDGAARRVTEDPRSWRRLTRLPAVSIGLALAVIATVHVCNLNGWPIAIDDEGTYVAQAWALYDGKLAHYTYWYDHPPAGWFQLAFWLALPNLLGIAPSVEVARYVMVGYTLVSALLLYRLTRNLGGRHLTGLFAMLVWALCPLVVAESRQVLLDNLTTPWLLGALVLATNSRRALWQHVAAGAVFGIAVLTKETTLLLAPAVAIALWVRAYRPTRAFSLVGAFVAGGIVTCFYPLFALLRNELLSGSDHVSIQYAVGFQLLDRAGSGTVLDPDSNVRELLDGWFAYDSMLLIVGAAAAVICLVVARLRCIGVAVLILVAMMLRPGGYVPAMYVVAILPFAAVAVVMVAQMIILRTMSVIDRPRWTHGRAIARAVAVVLIVLALVPVADRWTGKLAEATTRNLNTDREQALAWMTTNLDKDSRVLVDDSYWNNFVRAGWSGDGWSGPIWYFKLDLDPSAREANLPGGWQDIDFIVMTRTLRVSVLDEAAPPLLAEAYANSVPFYTWGDGANQVQLRRIVDPSPAATASPGSE